MMKLYVGIAPFEGRLHAPCVTSLLGEQINALTNGVYLGVKILQGAHYIAESYNIMLADFLKSDYDMLAFVEWDVSWNPEEVSLVALAQMGYDFIGGSTRFKKEPEEYMVGWIPDRAELWADKNGCIEVAWIPQGFCVASREMCQKMWDSRPDTEYELHGQIVREVFHDGFREGRRLGQDIGWCFDWRDMGGKVFVHPELELTHTACVGHSYTGRLGDFLRKRVVDEGIVPMAATVAPEADEAA